MRTAQDKEDLLKNIQKLRAPQLGSQWDNHEELAQLNQPIPMQENNTLEQSKGFTPESIHQANKAKGFYDMELTIIGKMKDSQINLQDFSDEEIAAVTRAFQMQRIALMVSELGEAVEALRKDKTSAQAMQSRLESDSYPIPVSELDPANHDHIAYYKEVYKDTVEDEKADTVIRIYDDAGRTGYDLEAHIKMKIAVNAQREFMHGKNC